MQVSLLSAMFAKDCSKQSVHPLQSHQRSREAHWKGSATSGEGHVQASEGPALSSDDGQKRRFQNAARDKSAPTPPEIQAALQVTEESEGGEVQGFEK